MQNAQALAEGMKRNGFRLVSGGTDNHLMLVDVGARGVTGKECQVGARRGRHHRQQEHDSRSRRARPSRPAASGWARPAVTTRGMKEAEMAAIADMISEVLLDIKNVDAIAKVRQRVRELTARFPLPY